MSVQDKPKSSDQSPKRRCIDVSASDTWSSLRGSVNILREIARVEEFPSVNERVERWMLEYGATWSLADALENGGPGEAIVIEAGWW